MQSQGIRDLGDRVERAIQGDGLTVVFQPIVEIATGRVAGFEALSRFAGCPPTAFFAAAATAGLAIDLERTAIRTALRFVGELPRDAYISLNVSPNLALSGRLPELLAGMPLSRIVIEITENAHVDDYSALERSLWGLRARGVRLAVDDAGAGYSGMVQILKLRPEIIKLDLAVTRSVDRDTARQALVSSLVAFAERINATIVAEGVETQQESAMLQAIGVRCAQGYLTGKPAPVAFLPAQTTPARTTRDQLLQRREVRAAVKRHRQGVARPRRRLAVVLVALVTLLTLLSAGAMAAEAEPGNGLYRLKLLIEDVRLALERDPEAALALHLEFASRRVFELTSLLAEETDERVLRAVVARLERHVSAVAGGAGLLGNSARSASLRERGAMLLSLEGTRLSRLTTRRCDANAESAGCRSLGRAIGASSRVAAGLIVTKPSPAGNDPGAKPPGKPGAPRVQDDRPGNGGGEQQPRRLLKKKEAVQVRSPPVP